MMKFCNRLAYIILAVLLLAVFPFVLPRIFGYVPYGILTNSMEPAYPVGSLIYVKYVEPASIENGEVITFKLDVKSKQTATHRVVSNVKDQQQFITKGDHNEEQDVSAVAYERFIGKAVCCIPFLGTFYAWLVSAMGIAASSFLLGMVIILWIIVYRMKKEISD